MTDKVCRVCGVTLVSGVNITPSYLQKRNYACRPCVNTAQRKRNRGNSKRHRRQNTSVHGRWAHCRWLAKKRGVPFTLTKDQYATLIRLPCTYCGGPLPECGSGLDQKIAGRGYGPGTAIPCCHACNTAKSDMFTYEETLKHIGPAIRAVREERISDGNPAPCRASRPAQLRIGDPTTTTVEVT